MFDAPPEAKCEKTYDFEFPWDDEPWNVGLVVGPSGSGKSTVARHVWGDRPPLSWDGAGMIDDFDGPVEAVSSAVSSVGFSTVPAWLRPHRVLSMGEQFRAEVARRILGEDDPIVIDEYTSVVDRQVAKVASHAIQRYVRAQSRRLVAVGCHYDVIDWLQPDWVLDMATCSFTRRRLQRRPAIECVVGRLPRAAWRVFSPFHYMSAELPPATHGFGLWANGQLACSAWLAVFPHPKAKDTVRVARVVTLPDYQGMGFAFRLLETLGAALKAGGRRLRNYPAHPAFVAAHKPPTWTAIKEQAFAASAVSATGQMKGGGDRFCAVFEYAGPSNARFATALGVQRQLGPSSDTTSDDSGPTIGQVESPPELPVASQAMIPRREERSCPGIDSTKRERIDWCIHLMSSGEWDGYASRAPLSIVWEVEDSTIRNYAAEAQRTLALDEEDTKQAKISHAAWLRDLADEARATRNRMTGLPDFASAIKARETAAKFQGIVLATGVEVTGKGGGPVAMTLDDVDEALKAAHANAAESGAPSEKND